MCLSCDALGLLHVTSFYVSFLYCSVTKYCIMYTIFHLSCFNLIIYVHHYSSSFKINSHYINHWMNPMYGRPRNCICILILYQGQLNRKIIEFISGLIRIILCIHCCLVHACMKVMNDGTHPPTALTGNIAHRPSICNDFEWRSWGRRICFKFSEDYSETLPLTLAWSYTLSEAGSSSFAS